MYYTGVGSRESPADVLQAMRQLAGWLAMCGYRLRSGGAPGADTAFEEAAREACGQVLIYLPWQGFNGRVCPQKMRPSPEAYGMASTVHPAWHGLTSGARSLHARNCHQVLGDDLHSPSDFVVCWTPDGCETEAARTRETGGTATAIVLACRNNVPVFNMRNEGWQDRLNALVASSIAPR